MCVYPQLIAFLLTDNSVFTNNSLATPIRTFKIYSLIEYPVSFFKIRER